MANLLKNNKGEVIKMLNIETLEELKNYSNKNNVFWSVLECAGYETEYKEYVQNNTICEETCLEEIYDEQVLEDLTVLFNSLNEIDKNTFYDIIEILGDSDIVSDYICN